MFMLMPLPRLSLIDVLRTDNWAFELAPAIDMSIPWPGFPRKPKIWQSSIINDFPEMNRMPLVPFPAPLSDKLRSVTTIVLGLPLRLSLTMTPEVRLARMPPKPWPFPPSMVMHLVVVIAPNPPGSSALISPLAASWKWRRHKSYRAPCGCMG